MSIVWMDIAEMADGEVFLGQWDAAAPLLRVTGWSRTEIARANGRIMSLLDVTTEAVAGPVTVDGVLALDPDGWALAAVGGQVQLWRYSGATWTVAATAEIPDVNLIWGMTLLVYRGVPYLMYTNSTMVLIQRGSALVETPPATLPPAVADMLATPFYWSGMPTAVQPKRAAAARWQGRWWGVAASGGGLGWWDGQAVRPVATMAHMTHRVIGGTAALHTFGFVAGGSEWSCYRNLQLAVETVPYRVMSGHAQGTRVWLVGAAGMGNAWLIDTPIGIGAPGSAPSSYTYHVLRIDEAEAIVPAVYEARQYGGLGTTVALSVFEARMGVRRPPLQEEQVFEGRQYGGHGTTGVIQVFEARQQAGHDPDAPSPELYEGRQSGVAPWPASQQVYEGRQYGLGHGGLVAGEAVRYYLSEDTERVATAVLVESNEASADQEALRVLARGDDEGLAEDAWGSYQQLTPGMKTELERPGLTVRVAVVKAAAADVPDVSVLTKRD